MTCGQWRGKPDPPDIFSNKMLKFPWFYHSTSFNHSQVLGTYTIPRKNWFHLVVVYYWAYHMNLEIQSIWWLWNPRGRLAQRLPSFTCWLPVGKGHNRFTFHYVCVCLCVCVSLCVCMHARMHACTHACMHECMYVCMYVMSCHVMSCYVMLCCVMLCNVM